jgi:hypothetical protein
MRNVSTKLNDNYSQRLKKIRAPGMVEGEAEIYNRPVKPRQEPAPPVPGGSRSSGFFQSRPLSQALSRPSNKDKDTTR